MEKERYAVVKAEINDQVQIIKGYSTTLKKDQKA